MGKRVWDNIKSSLSEAGLAKLPSYKEISEHIDSEILAVKLRCTTIVFWLSLSFLQGLTYNPVEDAGFTKGLTFDTKKFTKLHYERQLQAWDKVGNLPPPRQF